MVLYLLEMEPGRLDANHNVCLTDNYNNRRIVYISLDVSTAWDSNVRRSREMTEMGRDVQTIVDCGYVLRATLCLHK